MKTYRCCFLLAMACPLFAQTQTASIKGQVTDQGLGLPLVNLWLENTETGTATDGEGHYSLEGLAPGVHVLRASALGYEPFGQTLALKPGEERILDVVLLPMAEALEGTVVTGTLKPVSRLESPVPVEVYGQAFLDRNPTPSIFEALQLVNGVRPQINCNVCNTGDIHINGLEGPYTQVLIDGMPLVSGLGTVYGLMGIPNSLIEQIEIVKGPASSLYGSEAVGGLINIITKNALTAPDFFAESFMTDWEEYNLDLGGRYALGERTELLTGVNYFRYGNPVDDNGDNFTDVTLQERISIFQKAEFRRREPRLFSLAGRLFLEDRWGGEMQWTPDYRGGDEIYGESIRTHRWELLGKYQLPVKDRVMLSLSYTGHRQNAAYGDSEFLADQEIGFAQLHWDKTLGIHDLLVGTALRYDHYDDNTPATAVAQHIWIPGVFLQDEMALAPRHTVLAGLRYDHDPRHGNILTPRMAYKWKVSEHGILRLNAGTGFRVVNLFTEEHAALSGAREVVIAEALRPERSLNVNLNYLQRIYGDDGTSLTLDASVFHTHFSNAILPDYDTNPEQIIYANLEGRSISQGISAQLDLSFKSGPMVMLGATWQDVYKENGGHRERQMLTERFSATWSLSHTFRPLDLTVDYTGNLYGPMRLPLLGPLDPRKPHSPTWGIQNIQFTYDGLGRLEIYGGIKNLLDWTPDKGNPFIIARAHDPFDKLVERGADGQILPTTENPYALSFDPAYVYGPNQGIRGFFGLRYTLSR